MPTIQLELFKAKVLADGKHPVYIRVTHMGKQVRKIISSATVAEYIGNPEKCLKGTSSSIRQLNIDIEDEFSKYSAIFKKLVRSGKTWEPGDVFATVKTETKHVKTFWEIGDLYVASLSGMTKETMAGIINKFKKFVKNDKLLLSEIDTRLIDGYIFFMRNVKQRNGRVNKEKTVKNNLKVLRFVSNFGSSKKNKFDTRPDDLHDFKLPPEEDTDTEFLTVAELDLFEKVQLPAGTIIRECQQAFLLAIYLRGMRIGDMIQLRQDVFSKTRLQYETGKNKRDLNMALVPKAIEIINEYLDGREYLFHFYKPQLNDSLWVKHIKSRTSLINKNLKIIAKRAGIEKNVRTHIARHSFANILDSRTVDLSIIQGLLGHGTRAMTEKYIKKIRKASVLDEAVNDVFG